MTKPAKGKPGRPSAYNERVADLILDALIEGQSLRTICAADDMPDRSTVVRWMTGNEEFAAKCAHARTLQADLMDDKILETADACTAETAAADRVKIAAYQWRAAKLAPKKYGDKVDVNHAGEVGMRVVRKMYALPVTGPEPAE